MKMTSVSGGEQKRTPGRHFADRKTNSIATWGATNGKTST